MNDNQELKTKEFTLRPDDTKAWSAVSSYLTKHDSENLGIVITHVGKIRTLTQNNCIHKVCRLWAQALNESGQYLYEKVPTFMYGKTVDAIFNPEDDSWYVQLPWTEELVKIKWWHKIQRIVYPHAVNGKGEVSTSELNTIEVGEVYKIISQNIAAERGIDVPWPSARG